MINESGSCRAKFLQTLNDTFTVRSVNVFQPPNADYNTAVHVYDAGLISRKPWRGVLTVLTGGIMSCVGRGADIERAPAAAAAARAAVQRARGARPAAFTVLDASSAGLTTQPAARGGPTAQREPTHIP
ncbi:unnamed protein product [Spodoptera exigua]|nr:unnamed protein product [Spodoptera exigua]